MHILVIEDDEDINHLLCEIIIDNGYTAQPAYSGTEALLQLERKNWSLVLLDLMLPGKSGEEILAILKENLDVPVIIISAKEEQLTKVNMLRAGADDYITKPFNNDEVAARIDVQLRRYQYPLQSEKLMYKDIIIDEETGRVYVNAREVKLTAIEYNILKLLLSFPKKMFTKQNIFESVWDEDYYGEENIVNVHMSRLRSKLAMANNKEEYIETIWGMGYRLK